MYDSFEGFDGKQKQSKNVFDSDGSTEIKTFEAKIMKMSLMSKRSDSNSKLSGMSKTKISHQLPITNKVDFGSFIIFNFSYLLFNMIYWTSYLK